MLRNSNPRFRAVRIFWPGLDRRTCDCDAVRDRLGQPSAETSLDLGRTVGKAVELSGLKVHAPKLANGDSAPASAMTRFNVGVIQDPAVRRPRVDVPALDRSTFRNSCRYRNRPLASARCPAEVGRCLRGIAKSRRTNISALPFASASSGNECQTSQDHLAAQDALLPRHEQRPCQTRTIPPRLPAGI
jgi:hypothetical protein